MEFRPGDRLKNNETDRVGTVKYVKEGYDCLADWETYIQYDDNDEREKIRWDDTHFTRIDKK